MNEDDPEYWSEGALEWLGDPEGSATKVRDLLWLNEHGIDSLNFYEEEYE